ncbi:MAG TPA: preprotein translocase subunit YajC [Ruminococcaceae bacterium]|nr:preprotein translocase subunit YajC [Oscillospiraceae bacterium]
MNLNIYTLAADTSKQSGPQSIIVMVLYLAVIFGAMYFLLIRPQRKKQKEEKKMRDNLQVGDEIITIGGIYGRVISLKEDTLVIESASDHSKLTVARWALQTNLTVHDDTASK